MDIYLKIVAVVLLSVTLMLLLSKYAADISLLLALCVSCAILLLACQYFMPILDFARKLTLIGNIDNEILTILLKVSGIGILSQIAILICNDAGQTSIAKALQITTTAVILCVCVPLMEQILTLIEAMMKAV